jgi:outer membrane biosynthesis protein TonB
MSGYTHDETIYYMTVKVVRENGRLIATVSGYKDRATSKADAILYINEYEEPDEESKPDDEESSKPNDEESSKPTDEESSKPNDEESSKPSENESSEPGGEESSEPSENESSEPSGEESSKPNNEDSSDSQNGTPDTGDQAQSLFWMILMAVAAIGLILGMKYHMTIQKRESK